jgi:cell division protein FtsB
MEKEKRKQFSLSLLIRVLLGVIVVVSIGIFANSLMRYNQLVEEEKKLELILNNLIETREELVELLGSGERVEELLSNYEEYQAILASGTAEGEALVLLEEQLAQLRELINSSENKEYIVRIAKDRLGLYFPDEEIIYNDQNQ